MKRLFPQISIWLAIMAALLFLPAGTIAWWEAWVFLGIIASVGSAAGLWFARHDPGLLRERLSSPFQAGQPGWDKMILSAFLLVYFMSFVIMALDAVRWRTSHMPRWGEVAGGILILISHGLILRVFAENSFAAPVVRIQDERGQRLITTGPYAVVRHPMYGSAILFFLGTPLLLGSFYGLVFLPVFILLLAVRAVLEERMLAQRFPHYTAYSEKVRYRLIPFVW